MKRILLSLTLIAGIFLNANAQQQDAKFKASLGGEFLYPFGNSAEFYSGGYGGSLQGEVKLSPKLSATVSGGYISLSVSQLYKDIFTPWNITPKNTIIYPVKAGLKYDFYKKIYASAEAGVAISPDKTARATSFAYAGGIGTSFEVSDKSSIDVGLRYEAWSLSTKDTYSFVGIRAAYAFSFGK